MNTSNKIYGPYEVRSNTKYIVINFWSYYFYGIKSWSLDIYMAYIAHLKTEQDYQNRLTNMNTFASDSSRKKLNFEH
jgi:hypothetical protein